MSLNMNLTEFAIKNPRVVHAGVWMFTFAVMFISFVGVSA